MRRLIAAAVLMAAMVAVNVHAQDNMTTGAAAHNSGGLGFHSTSAPLGVRWWLSGQKIGIDLGFGFASTPAPTNSDEKLTGWTIEGGVPIVIKSWDKVHFLFRPGASYSSQDVETAATPFTKDQDTSFGVTGELEAEVFLAENMSVSASHGVGFESFKAAGASKSITDFSTIGRNFTEVGFHVYLFGGK